MNKQKNLKPDFPQIINAAGTLTSLGGCQTRPEANEAMQNAANEFVPYEQYLKEMGDYLAPRLSVPAALVTSGAAAALTLAAAACMVKDNLSLAAQLPAPPSRHKIIIQCSHRNPFERAILLSGARLVQVGDAIRTRPEDLFSTIDDQTAAVVHFLQAEMLDASLKLVEVLEIAHADQVPVIVDAAAELPPKSNLWELVNQGADLVIFSGGKDLRGPQASGLMVGRPDLIASARMQSAPHEHVIGRPLKPSKEAIAGLVAAIDAYLLEDEAARFAEWERIAGFIETSLMDITNFHVRRFVPTQPFIQPACTPRVAVSFNPGSPIEISALKRALWEGHPYIATEIIGDELILNTHTLSMGEAQKIIHRLDEIIQQNAA
jgi:L-seryl-tRNA(Ser) seleniumtransferase